MHLLYNKGLKWSKEWSCS